LTLRRLGIKHQILSPTERNRFCGSRLCPKAPIGPLMHAARFLGKRCKRVRAAAEPGPSAVGVFDRHVVRTWTRDCWGYSFLRPIAAKCNPGASSRSATRFNAPNESPEASARAAAVISESMAIPPNLSLPPFVHFRPMYRTTQGGRS
jgi:hypothetical protein